MDVCYWPCFYECVLLAVCFIKFMAVYKCELMAAYKCELWFCEIHVCYWPFVLTCVLLAVRKTCELV